MRSIKLMHQAVGFKQFVRFTTAFLLVGATALSTGTAYARIRGHLSIGVMPFFYPYPYAYPYGYPYGYYPYPRYYYYGYSPQPPPVVQQPEAPPEPVPSYWYFCRSANGYYPYVSHCPEGWRAVPATPVPPPGPSSSDNKLR